MFKEEISKKCLSSEKYEKKMFLGFLSKYKFLCQHFGEVSHHNIMLHILNKFSIKIDLFSSPFFFFKNDLLHDAI